MSQAKLGSGIKFAKLKEKLAKLHNVKDTSALSTPIQSQEFGNTKMQSLAPKRKK